MSVQEQIVSDGIVIGPLADPAIGTIMVTATPTEDFASPDVQLSGSGNGWSVAPPLEADASSVLHLKPEANQSLPVRYQLTLTLAQSSRPSFSFQGVQIYHFDPDQPRFERVAIFFPASSDQVQVSFLHNIPHGGEPVTYGMSIGLSDGSFTSWDYPTISFDPQAGPPEM